LTASHLNRRQLPVLSAGDGDVGRHIRHGGEIREGELHPNRSATPDDEPPVFSRAARG
jgi:phosphate transport system substrate-binding protein